MTATGHHKWRLEDRARRIAEAKKQKEEAERKERERIAALEKAKIDRLLNDAEARHRAEQIRAYVSAVTGRITSTDLIKSPDVLRLWRPWALAEADRIDPVKSASFLVGFEDLNAGHIDPDLGGGPTD